MIRGRDFHAEPEAPPVTLRISNIQARAMLDLRRDLDIEGTECDEVFKLIRDAVIGDEDA